MSKVDGKYVCKACYNCARQMAMDEHEDGEYYAELNDPNSLLNSEEF